MVCPVYEGGCAGRRSHCICGRNPVGSLPAGSAGSHVHSLRVEPPASRDCSHCSCGMFLGPAVQTGPVSLHHDLPLGVDVSSVAAVPDARPSWRAYLNLAVAIVWCVWAVVITAKVF